MNTTYWILPLLIGIAFGVVGYLLGHKVGLNTGATVERKKSQDDYARLQNDLKACQESQLVAIAKAMAPVRSPTTSFNAKQANALLGQKVKKDDLKLIEGIGPKIEQLFHAAGIKTWKTLSDSHVDQCQQILDKGGVRYKIHDPASWPMQAKMCHEGKWKQLAQWQERHKHGKY